MMWWLSLCCNSTDWLNCRVLDFLERDEITLAANGTHIATMLPGRLNGSFRKRVIGKYHSRSARLQQVPEQSHQLGIQIGLNRRMIIHVVPAEIGKPGSGQPNPVEPVLV